jgi:hypothetical protein
MRGSVAAWRLASSIVGRRTALRYLAIGAASALAGSVVAACSSPTVTPPALPENADSGGSTPAAGTTSAATVPAAGTRPSLGAVALAAFAGGTWAWSAPDANDHAGTLVVTPDGDFTISYAPPTGESADPSMSVPSPKTGHWEFAGGTLTLSIEGDTGTATKVPDSVSGDATAQFGWQFRLDGAAGTIDASWNRAAKTLVLKRQLDPGRPSGRPPQVITLTRQS